MIRQSLMLATTAAVLVGCGGAGTPSSTDAPSEEARPDATSPADDDLGGFGAPVPAEGELPFGPGRPTTGTLVLQDNGCWSVQFADTDTTHVVAFPVGYEVPSATDPATVVGPDGQQFASGDQVDGLASEVPLLDLPGGFDSRWGNYAVFCDPQAGSIAVFDELEPASDPLALTEDEIVDLVAGATLSTSWPCGRGWAMSTEDGAVGLFLHQQSSDQLEAGATVALPDDDWVAQVTVGKHLFVNHCDDVFESWEPLPVVAAEWPITAGTLEVLDTFPAGYDGASVRAVLTGAKVQTPSGSTIDLGTVELENRSFNFFAG